MMNQARGLELEMKGLELSRSFYEEIGKPVFENLFPEYRDKVAAGLVGEGSECFGFDDLVSMDHDYGPAFCIWLPRAEYEKAGKEMQKVYEVLPKEYKGVATKFTRSESSGRRGILEIESFYRKFLGIERAPKKPETWLRIPEEYLAVATNGEVFVDNLGEFSRIREELLAYYPEDVRLKKIAARAIVMAHSGQCNYGRMMRRHDTVAATLALNEFLQATISMVYLLNKKYKPYYKWMWQGMKNLDRLTRVRDLLRRITESGPDRKAWYGGDWDTEVYGYELNTNDKVVVMIEEICALIIEELKRQNLSNSTSDYLEEHAYAVRHRILNDSIRSLPILMS